jgi:hypothetical protein
MAEEKPELGEMLAPKHTGNMPAVLAWAPSSSTLAN